MKEMQQVLESGKRHGFIVIVLFCVAIYSERQPEGGEAKTEFYDLSEDISESNNIMYNATCRKTKRKMLKNMRKMACV